MEKVAVAVPFDGDRLPLGPVGEVGVEGQPQPVAVPVRRGEVGVAHEGRAAAGEFGHFRGPARPDQRGPGALQTGQALVHALGEVVRGDRAQRLEKFIAVGVVGVVQEDRLAEVLHQVGAPEAAQPGVAYGSGPGLCEQRVEDLAQIAGVAGRVELRGGGVAAVLALQVEVAGVVADDRHRAGPEDGGHHEQQVLADVMAHGEKDPLLTQVSRAVHLVDREAVVQGRALVRDRLAVALHQAVRGAPQPVRDGHLADDDVRAVAPAHRVHPLQRLGTHAVVVVDELDVLAAGRFDGDIARMAGPAGVGQPDQTEERVACGQFLQPVGGGVRGAVVDEEHLEFVGRQRLPLHRVDQGLDEDAGVVGGHHHGDLE